MPSSTDPETRQQIVSLRQQGRTYQQIQDELGVSAPIVAKYLSRAGLTRPRNPAVAPGGGPEGVSDFQPPAPKKPQADSVPQCGHCKTELSRTPEDGDKCGNCGAEF